MKPMCDLHKGKVVIAVEGYKVTENIIKNKSDENFENLKAIWLVKYSIFLEYSYTDKIFF